MTQVESCFPTDGVWNRQNERVWAVNREAANQVQQDGARAHTAARSQNWCKENLPNFIEKDRWPANSPDLNPLDYSIWNEIVQGMNWDRVECKESLKAQIMLSVKKIRPQVVLDSCTSFYTRVRRVATSDGSYLQK